MGDRRCAPELSPIETRSTAAADDAAVEEPGNARDNFEWVLVAWPEVLATAERLLGAQLICECCGRQGRVTEVLEFAEWRRRRREETS